MKATQTKTQAKEIINEEKTDHKWKTLTGTVVSAKNKDTVNVEIVRFVRHPLYGKPMRRTDKLLAHNTGVALQVGDSVMIEACRPMSKRKHFIVKQKIG